MTVPQTAAEKAEAKLDVVRKLLAKAESTDSPAEAEALTAKAATLIATYGIDRARLAEEVPTSDVVGDRVVDIDNPYAVDKATLLFCIVKPLRVQAVRKTGYTRGGKRTTQLHLFGFESDLERVELLYTSLLVQSAQALAKEHVPSWENTTAYRKSWLLGFSHAIRERLEEAERKAAAEEPSTGRSTALVLIDRKDQVDRRFKEVYPKIQMTHRRLTGGGYGSGQAEGKRARLGGTGQVGSGARGALH